MADQQEQEPTAALYHEKQQLYRCGIHALNNLLQARVFDKDALDAACVQLTAMDESGAGGGVMSWVLNPHRAPLGLGNYDVNALVLVLQQKGYSMQWRDKRTPVNKETLDLDVAEGVLCNVVMDTFYRSFWTQRHWFAIRKVEGVYYNLDSKLSAPAPFESERECYLYLQMLVHTGKCELFEITKTPSTEASSEPTPSS